MGLVCNDRVAPSLRLGLLAQVMEGEGSGLDRYHDDGCAHGQGFGQFLRLGRARPVDGDDLGASRVQLEHGVGHLLVEHVPVGHDDHRIEDLLVVRVVEGREPERGPHDGVGLAGASRVLDQVAVPDTVILDVADDLLHGRELVEPGETQRDGGLLLARDRVGLLLLSRDQVLGQDRQEHVLVEDVGPEVFGGRTLGVQGIALAAVVALVEGQEGRLLPIQLRRHGDLVVGDHEVHQCPLAPREQQFLAVSARVAVVLVLHLPPGDRLGELGLQLDGRHGQAVEEEHQVDGLLAIRHRVVHLPHHAQPVVLVVLDRLRVQGFRGLGLGHEEA